MESILNERKKLYDLIEYIKHNNPEEQVSKAMKILKKLLTNVKNNPEELKFRMIKTTNQTISNDLMNVNGIIDLLHYLGYIATNDGNFLLEISDLNNVGLCLNILNTDVGIYTQKEYVKETEGDTSIFIYPGYKFKCIDGLITNFHLPQSTLLMLVSALAGKEYIMNAYNEAVKDRYRFFSFGDAMFIK